MVCKNCGSDLKPGMKYCLNCGSYIDEDDSSDKDTTMDFSEENSEVDSIESKSDFSFDEGIDDYSKTPKKKNKKSKYKMKDIIVYGVLILIIIVSVIVMIVSLLGFKSKSEPVPQPTNVVVEDNKVEVGNYTISFSGKLNYNQNKDVVYITDDKNYSFSYRNTLDDYELYSKDLNIFSEKLKNSGYEVLNSEKKEIESKEFIIYKFKYLDSVKYLYITKVDKKYVTMGTIEEIDGGDWSEALEVISSINDKIKFKDNEDSDDNINSIINTTVSDLSGIIK